MKVRIKRVDRSLPLPEYQTAGAVGFDMYSREEAVAAPGELTLLPANFIIETPADHMLMVVARSSTFKKKNLILANGAAIIDPDFCGDSDEMILQVVNMGKEPVKIDRGERIAQGIFVPVTLAKWEEVTEMKEVSRGGIGTTG